MFCAKCGKEVEENAAVCKACGYPDSAATQKKQALYISYPPQYPSYMAVQQPKAEEYPQKGKLQLAFIFSVIAITYSAFVLALSIANVFPHPRSLALVFFVSICLIGWSIGLSFYAKANKCPNKSLSKINLFLNIASVALFVITAVISIIIYFA